MTYLPLLLALAAPAVLGAEVIVSFDTGQQMRCTLRYPMTLDVDGDLKSVQIKCSGSSPVGQSEQLPYICRYYLRRYAPSACNAWK